MTITQNSSTRKETIEWCKKQDKGVRLAEPNDNVSEEYYKSAEETIRLISLIKNSGSNMWLAVMKYYAEYFAAYALLAKLGIKSEIHDCTIKIIKLLEKEKIVNTNLSKILEQDKELRLENQYYLKNVPVETDPNKMAEFLLSIRQVLDNTAKEDAVRIRKIINSY